MNFKKYEHSRVSKEQIRGISEKYLGKRGKVYWPLLKRKVWCRERRWCDLPYSLMIEATVDLAQCEMEYIEMEDLDKKLSDDICDYWADIMADWVSESEGTPVYIKNNYFII